MRERDFGSVGVAARLSGKAWDGRGDCEGTCIGTTARSDSEVIGEESHIFFTLNL